MTKVNKSEYVTIKPPLSARLGSGWSTSTGCPVKYIIFSMCRAGHASFGSSDLNRRNFAPVRFIRITYETVDLIKSLLWRFAVWSGVFWYFCKQFNLFYRFLFSGSIEFAKRIKK